MPKVNSKVEMETRPETVVTTQTVVEDRTEAPVEVAAVEYVSEDRDLGGGTVITTYGEPVGGFPGEEADAA